MGRNYGTSPLPNPLEWVSLQAIYLLGYTASHQASVRNEQQGACILDQMMLPPWSLRQPAAYLHCARVDVLAHDHSLLFLTLCAHPPRPLPMWDAVANRG